MGRGMSVQAARPDGSGRDPMREMLWACRGGFATAAVFSFFVNLLILTMPIYIFSLFDRVMGGGNPFTLAFLALFAFGALFVQALIDIARTYLFVRISAWIDSQIGEKVLAVSLRFASARGARRDIDMLTRMDSLRRYLSGENIFVLMDLPWVPFFLAFLFLLNFWIGMTATGIALVIFLLALANKWLTDPLHEAGTAAVRESMRKTDITLRNADTIDAMGMAPQLARRWSRDNDMALDRFARYARRSGAMGAVGRTMQLGSILAVMTVCAVLIVDPNSGLSQGAMMAAVILVGRVLMPVQAMVSGWTAMTTARKDYALIAEALRRGAAMPSPAVRSEPAEPPRGALEVAAAGFHPPTAEAPVLSDISFALEPGESLGIVGPTGSGKSSLARLLAGIDRPTEGSVRLDGRELHEWPGDEIGPHLGYLAQEATLFNASIRDNITRFDDGWTRESVLDAARLANIDAMVKHMPRGYQTLVGPGGVLLSGGQTQRVGLARALYGDVRLVVLDEPNSNLDAHGEQALAGTVAELKRRGATLVVILHRPNILRTLDYIMVMEGGRIRRFGRREEMLSRPAAVRPPQPAAERLPPAANAPNQATA